MPRPAVVIMALFIAAFVPVIAGCVMAPPPDLSSLVLAFAVYLYACGFTAMVGIPAYFLFECLNWVRWWSAVGVGLLAGAYVGVRLWKPYASAILDVPIMALTGAITAFVFWLIVGAGTPQQAPKAE